MFFLRNVVITILPHFHIFKSMEILEIHKYERGWKLQKYFILKYMYKVCMYILIYECMHVHVKSTLVPKYTHLTCHYTNMAITFKI